MAEPPPTRREERVQQRARLALGPEVLLTRWIVVTRAGPRRGNLCVGYRICRPVPGPADGPPALAVLGISPLRDEGVDLSDLGTPEVALEDALRRKAEGRGPYPDEAGGVPLPQADRPTGAGVPLYPILPLESELTTSTMDLPLV